MHAYYVPLDTTDVATVLELPMCGVGRWVDECDCDVCGREMVTVASFLHLPGIEPSVFQSKTLT